jgi:hypothetical protein
MLNNFTFFIVDIFSSTVRGFERSKSTSHEIDEAQVIIDSVNVDKQTIEDFKELKNEINKYHLEDPKKFLNVLRALKKYKYDEKRIVAEFSTRRSMKKERQEIYNDRCMIEDRVKKCKFVGYTAYVHSLLVATILAIKLFFKGSYGQTEPISHMDKESINHSK